MFLDSFYNVFSEANEATALIYKDERCTYKYLLNSIQKWSLEIYDQGIESGQVIALNGDFTPNSISLIFALIENANIIVPLNSKDLTAARSKYEIAFVDKIITIDDNDNVIFEVCDVVRNPECSPLYGQLRREKHPGLVLFTSGTSGKPKAAVHDLVRLLEKFKKRTLTLKTLNFLLFDHWGGLNTMFHTLSNGGVVLVLRDRMPATVCAFIEKYEIELLPASPTFFNLLLISQEYLNFDLSSLKLITYGSEPMPASTLDRIRNLFPMVKLQQTYGLIELGVLRSKSKSNDSLWVKVGGEGYQTRIVENMLEIKASSAMLGYLNAPSPFTSDGWFKTFDQVEVNGEYIKILGRKTEMIIIGGEKVYPTEIESILLELDNVAAAMVYAEKNVITGNIVCAKICLNVPEDRSQLIRRLKLYCIERLPKYKIPVKIEIVDDLSILYGDRFKKKRLQ